MTFNAVGVFGLTFDFLLKNCLSILWYDEKIEHTKASNLAICAFCAMVVPNLFPIFFFKICKTTTIATIILTFSFVVVVITISIANPFIPTICWAQAFTTIFAIKSPVWVFIIAAVSAVISAQFFVVYIITISIINIVVQTSVVRFLKRLESIWKFLKKFR